MFDTNNNMFARTVFVPSIPVTTDDILTVQWRLETD